MSKHQGYSTLGALIGGAVVGFLVFGYLGMRFFKDADGPLMPLACAAVGVSPQFQRCSSTRTKPDKNNFQPVSGARPS